VKNTQEHIGQGYSTFRQEITSIGKHSLVYFLGQALSRAVGFFMIPIYTRFIAPSDYGVLELVFIVGGSLAMLISMSVSDSLSRFYYAEKKQPQRDLVVSTTILGFAASGLPVVFLCVHFADQFSLLVLESKEYQYLFYIAFLTAWFTMLVDIGMSYLRMRYYSKTFLCASISQLILALSLNIYCVVYRQMGILGILYSNLISSATLGLILSTGILVVVKPHFSFSKLKRIIKFGLPLAPSRICLSLGFMSNRFFLQRFATLFELGIFSLGFKFGILISRFINTPINMFWSPRRLELLLTAKDHSHKTVARICTYNTFLSLFVALALSATIKEVLNIIADPRYHESYKIVPIIAITIVIGGLENHFNAGILIAKRTSYLTYSSIISIAVVLAWSFFFIPIYGIWGAASASLAGSSIRTILIYLGSQQFYRLPFELVRICKLFIVAFVLYALCSFVHLGLFLTLTIKLIIVGTFPLLLLLTNFFDDGEIDQLKRMWSFLTNTIKNRSAKSYFKV
jgi:O-antigen/teichoic acid export membrane protein